MHGAGLLQCHQRARRADDGRGNPRVRYVASPRRAHCTSGDDTSVALLLSQERPRNPAMCPSVWDRMSSDLTQTSQLKMATFGALSGCCWPRPIQITGTMNTSRRVLAHLLLTECNETSLVVLLPIAYVFKMPWVCDCQGVNALRFANSHLTGTLHPRAI